MTALFVTPSLILKVLRYSAIKNFNIAMQIEAVSTTGDLAQNTDSVTDVREGTS